MRGRSGCAHLHACTQHAFVWKLLQASIICSLPSSQVIKMVNGGLKDLAAQDEHVRSSVQL